MSGNESDTAKALTAIIDALTPLNSDERRRTVGAAMMFLGETALEPAKEHQGASDDDNGGDGRGYSATIKKWMKQNGITADELEQAFLIKEDKTFDIHDVPGTSKKVRALNTYILTGLGKFLVANERTFDDALARGFCVKLGCYDKANHAGHIAKKGTTFSGDKASGYTIAPQGMTRGAALVKELAAAVK